MGYRLHLYKGTLEEINSAFKNDDEKPYYNALKEVLCVEGNSAFYHIFNTAKSLFPKGTELYQKFQDSEDCPVIVTKKKLRDLIELFHRIYQQYLAQSLVFRYEYGDLDLSDPKVYNRCLGIDYELPKETKERDENHSKLCGLQQLSRDFLIHCHDGQHERFMNMLDDKDMLNSGDSMADIVYQLVYLYKTFSPSKVIIMTGW